MDSPIAAVRSRVVVRTLENPTLTVVGPFRLHGYVTVEAFTADGQSGLGYVRAFDMASVRGAHGFAVDLAESLIGLPASTIAVAWKRMWKRFALVGRAGLQVYALSALDTALWDLKAKLCGLPLYRLLGAAHQSVPSYYSGAFLSASDDDIVAQAERLQKVGYAAFKIRVGMPDPKRDIERAELIRKAYHGQLMMDAGCIFDRAGAIRAARDLAQFDPVWFEDPVSPERLTDLAAVRAASPIPIAGGELLYSEAQIAEFSRRDLYDHILFDLERIGGVSGWIKSAAIADQYGLRVSAHCFPEIAIHILCGLENSYFHEDLDWSHELFAEVPRIANGHAWPSEEPGLGLQFDEAFIRDHLVEEAVVGKASAIPKAIGRKSRRTGGDRS